MQAGAERAPPVRMAVSAQAYNYVHIPTYLLVCIVVSLINLCHSQLSKTKFLNVNYFDYKNNTLPLLFNVVF